MDPTDLEEYNLFTPASECGAADNQNLCEDRVSEQYTLFLLIRNRWGLTSYSRSQNNLIRQGGTADPVFHPQFRNTRRPWHDGDAP